ncbi:Squalene/phytoene synthase-domain-containing protein [Mycena sp. CBHHK59/15]|nr:Squalene/phytoene synthase-domain-containing protein [Mycena sp. CBHHK59/15]
MLPLRLSRTRLPPVVRRYSAPDAPTDPATYCRNLVRTHDYESFLVSKFWPAPLQDGYFAVKAFSTELAMVQDSVTVPTIGAVRMQFWRDAVKGVYADSPPRHPVALALHRATQTAALPAYHLKRIIDARDEELRTTSYQTSAALVAHAEGVSSSVLYLLLSLLGLGRSEQLAHAASHLGTAQTLATLLWSLPHHVGQRRMPIPDEICARHGVRTEEVFRQGGRAAGAGEAVYEFAVLANDHLLTAREVFKGMDGGRVPRGAMPVFLAGFDGFARSLEMRDWRLSWNIWSGYYRRMF